MQRKSPNSHLLNDQVTIVELKEKLNFQDFFVYILSCLSFWFGFCPPHAAGDRFVTRLKTLTAFQRGPNRNIYFRQRTLNNEGHRVLACFKNRNCSIEAFGPWPVNDLFKQINTVQQLVNKSKLTLSRLLTLMSSGLSNQTYLRICRQAL